MATRVTPVQPRGMRVLWWAPLIVLWLAFTGYVVAGLPVQPMTQGGSLQYLGGAANRPPGYTWLLYLFREAGGGADYSYLPAVQTLLIAAALLAFAWQLALLLRAPLAAAALVPLVWIHRGVWEATRFVISEGLFLPALLAALAFAAAYARKGTAASLAGAAFCCAAATLARNIGVVLLALPVLLVLLDVSSSRRRVLARLALVVLVALPPVLVGMAWQKARHGVFELGSYGGVSLLGKALLVLEPGMANDVVLAEVAPRAREARAAIATAPDYAASLRAQAQAYEELRWLAFYPAAAAWWPAWKEGDFAGESRLAGPVAFRVLAAEPVAYARLALRDWSGLLLYPHFWPMAWRDENTAHRFFSRCAESRRACWLFNRVEAPRLHGLSMLGTSVAGLLATLVLPWRYGADVLRGRAAPAERFMLAAAVVAQATLAASALAEAGLWRYTIVSHVMHAALAVWLVSLAFRSYFSAKLVLPERRGN